MEINRFGKVLHIHLFCCECLVKQWISHRRVEGLFPNRVYCAVCSCSVVCIFDVSAPRACEFTVTLWERGRGCSTVRVRTVRWTHGDTVSATARTKHIRAHFSARTERKCSARKWRKFLRFVQRTRLATCGKSAKGINLRINLSSTQTEMEWRFSAF